MIAANQNSPADWILELNAEAPMHDILQEMVKTRRLSPTFRALNQDVLHGTGLQRDRATAALQRMGLWFE